MHEKNIYLNNLECPTHVTAPIERMYREEEVNNTPQGNFEALWKIIDEQYCFLDYKQIDWNAIHDKYQPLITRE